jgi:hypothetical protein
MTKLQRFRAILFVAAYIGTLGIPGTPRDYMWAAEISSCVTCGDAADAATSATDSFPTLHSPSDIAVPSDPDQDSAVVTFE